MVSSDFEISESVIVENIKQRIDFHSATNVPFWEPGSNFGIFKQPSKNSRITSGSEDVAIRIC